MDLNAFRNEMLKEHNIGRQKYGNVPPLCLDANINKEAQTYAERLALIDMSLRHSKRTHLGENLFYWFNSDGVLCDARLIVDSFFEESQEYDFEKGVFHTKTGHFTQAVWKNSKKLGVGAAQSSESGAWYVCCNYFPPGNVRGEFVHNVLKPIVDIPKVV